MLEAGDPVPGLTIQLRTESGGPIVASELVHGRDIAEAMAELGFEAGLRCNGEALALSSLTARLRPVRPTTGNASGQTGRTSTGFTLEAQSSLGQPVVRKFSRRVFEPVAARASRRLIESGELNEGDTYFYQLELPECSVGPVAIEGNQVAAELRPIAPYLARAQRISGDPEQGRADEAYAREQSKRDNVGSPPKVDVGNADDTKSPDDPDYAVFYTRSAFEKAERMSRKGAASNPPVESGGLLLGQLYFCPETSTLFSVIEDALEASDSTATTYSLTFSAATWERLHAVIRARQRQPATRNQRILGQCHGHNFLPYAEGETCDGCPAQGSCEFSTAYLSESDRRWCRAVFPREPWQLSHIFGLTPRREHTSAFFGQRGTELERRAYYIVDDLSPDV